MNTYTGILKVKNSEVRISDKFKKKDFVVTDNAASYPQTILMQLTQDRCSLLDDANLGDEITCHYLLKGREWKNPQGEIKVFNTIDVFKIEIVRSNSARPQEETVNPLSPPEDDLLF